MTSLRQQQSASTAPELPGVRRALVVEDDVGIRRILVRMLQGFGVTTLQAASLKQASAMLAPPIDLVVADVRLPDGSGHAVIASALRLTPVPVLIAISGVASASEAFELARAGAVAFLDKPFGLRELERCFRDACEARAQFGTGSRDLSPRAERALHELTQRYRWTPRQAEAVRRTAEGVRRADLPAALGISEASCKTLVRRVLHRSGTHRLSDLAFAVLAAQTSDGLDNSAPASRSATTRRAAPRRVRAADASPPPPRGPRADEP